MAREIGYERQVRPQSGAALPQASAEAYGAGVGQALERAGETLHQIKLREYQLDRKETQEREQLEVNKRLAQARVNIDGITNQMRGSAEPGAAGHSEGFGKILAAQRETLLDGITEESVRNQATAAWDDYAARATENENTWAFGQATAKKSGDFVATRNISANRVNSIDDPNAFFEELAIGRRELATMTDLPPDLRDRLGREEVDQKLSVSYLNGLNDRNPAASLKMLEAGTFDTFLTPAQKEALMNGARAELRRLEAKAKEAASLGKGALNEEVATIKEKSGNGIDQAAEAAAIMPKLEAVGDTSNMEAMQQVQRESWYNKSWSSATKMQRQGRVAELTAIPQDKRTEEQDAELKMHLTIGRNIDAKFDADPVQWAIDYAPEGMKPPSLVNGWDARLKWWRSSVGTYGTELDILSRTEAEAMAAEMKTPAGEVAVMNRIAAAGGVDAVKIAREVAPENAYLQQIVTMPAQHRGTALDGRARLRENPKWKDMEETEAETWAKMRGQFDLALFGVSGTQRASIIEISTHMAAEYWAKDGRAPGELNAATRLEALNQALGATGKPGPDRKGGLGNWGGKAFLLPQELTAAEFGRRVGAKWQKDPPVNRDGKTPLNLAEARPVPAGRDKQGRKVYRFYTGARNQFLVLGKDNKPYEVAVTGAQ